MINNRKIIFVVQIVFTVFLFLQNINCKKKNDSPTSPQVEDSTAIPGWKLVWDDEFSGDSLDKTKWNYEINGNGGGNNELQYYTNLPENSYIKDGNLVIQALKKDYLGKHYTSARINTDKKGDWKYGRFEIKAKLPYGQGMWPAIWLLPSDWVYGGWPASGEIDIMEMLGNQTNKIYGTIHFGSSVKDHQHSGGNYTLSSGTFAQRFHVFALEWDSTGMKWYIDGFLYHKESHGKPFDQRFHLLLNVAVGGNWPGNPDQSTLFPQKMYVDYVRVYQKQ